MLWVVVIAFTIAAVGLRGPNAPFLFGIGVVVGLLGTARGLIAQSSSFDHDSWEALILPIVFCLMTPALFGHPLASGLALAAGMSVPLSGRYTLRLYRGSYGELGTS
jgi:hypothetical protein